MDFVHSTFVWDTRCPSESGKLRPKSWNPLATLVIHRVIEAQAREPTSTDVLALWGEGEPPKE